MYKMYYILQQNISGRYWADKGDIVLRIPGGYVFNLTKGGVYTGRKALGTSGVWEEI